MRHIQFIAVLLTVAATTTQGQVIDSIPSEQIRLAHESIDTGLVIQMSYGFGRMRHNDLVGNYADNRLVEFHLGWRNWQSIPSLDIPGLRQSMLFYGATTPSDESGKVSSETSRFGLRTSSGYGWANATGMLLPYNSSAMVWTKLDIDAALLDSVDRGLLQDFDDARRFGHSIETGVELIAGNGLSVRFGVERALVFPRHLFFKEMLSSIIQGVLADGVGMTSAFAVGSRSMSPLVSFVLSSAIRFGISELRRDEMNWPFDSAPPLVFDTFEIGIAYAF
jgi:hypothetical protein